MKPFRRTNRERDFVMDLRRKRGRRSTSSRNTKADRTVKTSANTVQDEGVRLKIAKSSNSELEVADETEECSICLEQIADPTQSDSCPHSFCFSCLQEWIKYSDKCPLCNTPMKTIRFTPYVFRENADSRERLRNFLVRELTVIWRKRKLNETTEQYVGELNVLLAYILLWCRQYQINSVQFMEKLLSIGFAPVSARRFQFELYEFASIPLQFDGDLRQKLVQLLSTIKGT
ncbi:zinc finger, C3HC4 type [Oesophagostomum dentatum]|uniref:Zinc finger, C3HC4 type n=1 Tax=Oesophagostomum dentatum TaxID=61180 RepID=A0A0B1T2M1_OESDE|nr:zinc finger, C3HC4 type [Oesophagostomum dentatum]